VDNGLLTPTMKLRRSKIMEHYAAEIEKLYEGH
jgi:long-chain acyl-CoA synthetase